MNGLESYLIELTRYGKPRLSMTSSGWYCKIEMHVESEGCSFEIASEFGMSTPISAATQCLERVRVALKGFGETEDVERLR